MSSFLKEFNSKADSIITNAVVLDATSVVDGQEIPPYFYSENAAWDTGAQFTFISPRIVQALGLTPSGKGRFMGIGGDQESYIYRVNIALSNGELVRNAEVYCSDLDDYDLLLGMDIITLTDFVITNANGKTTFQFRTPSEGGVIL